jgi:putative transposase
MAMHSDDAMTDYRRLFVPGATYFFTANLLDRRSQLLVMNTTSLRHASAYTIQHHPFSMDAIVTLPDHIHTIWTLPPDDDDFPLRWRLIKSTFTRLIPKGEAPSSSRCKKHERGIWQRRYWEHRLRDDADFARHLDYRHFNPAKHGYVSSAAEWPFSSFRRMVRLGVYPETWVGPDKRYPGGIRRVSMMGFVTLNPSYDPGSVAQDQRLRQ